MRKLPVLRPRPTRPDAAYYSRLRREARFYRVNMARKQWCDFSHEHFDWKGFGDRSWVDRRRHLAVLLKAFRRAQIELSAYQGEYQVFASITPGDSAGYASGHVTLTPSTRLAPSLRKRATSGVAATRRCGWPGASATARARP